MEKSTYLTFLVGEEFFAVNVSYVLEVLQQPQITPVPKTPDHILGIVNFRGDILPVIDTRRKFNIDNDGLAHRRITIVFDVSTASQAMVVAATADAVNDVIEVDDSEIKAVPDMGLSYDARFIIGAIRRNNRFVMMLDMAKVFSVGDLAVADAVAAEQSI